MVKFFDLSRQNEQLRDDIDLAISEVVGSGKYILGENVTRFENNFANYIGTKNAIGVANGTDALKLSLMALDVGHGDEVITVSNTAFPTILAISNVGATPVFTDVGNDYCIDTSQIGKKITEKTKAIIPVHLYGNPCSTEELLEVSEHYSIPIVEDACQAHGAAYNGRRVGTFGVTGAFSFYPTKNLGCFGDGGAITTNNSELAEKIKALRNCGQSNRERYVHPYLGMNSRLDEIQATILSLKLGYLDNWISARRRIARSYMESIENAILPHQDAKRKHAYHLFVIRSHQRDRLIDHLKRNGIDTMIHYPVPAHMQRPFVHKTYSLPNTEKFAKEIVSIPIYPELAEEEVSRVVDAINSFR